MKKLLIILFMLPVCNAFSQAEEVKNYTWDVVPKFDEIPAEFMAYPAVVLKDYRLCENKVGQSSYKAFVVKHCAIKILKEEGINDFNKVSINKSLVRDYRDLQARVIKPDGKIIVLSEDRIIKKEDSNNRQFVFEGVEKGDIIEYFYVIKEMPDFSDTEYFQRTIPVLKGKFQLNNISAAKAYFSWNNMNIESTKKHNIFTVTNLPAYKHETQATNIAHLAKVAYFLDTDFLYDFEDYYWSLNSFAEGQNAKSMIKQFVEELALGDTAVPLDDRLKKMDIHLKENFRIDANDDYKDLLKTKKISRRQVLYLYKDVLDYLKVPYQFVATTDKFEDKFDKKMVMPSTLSEIMIYIPETDKYLLPFYFWMPYGAPTAVSINNDGVYYNRIKNDVQYSFKKLGGALMDDNVNTTSSEITVDDDMETVSVNKKSAFTGYRSFYYRNVLQYVPEDKMKEWIIEEVFDEVDLDLKSYTFDNKEYKFNYDHGKPFTFNIEATIKESWIENAGKNYLITLGKVLGKQGNLYQETERINPIDLHFPHKYKHKIKFTIPAGYAVKNVSTLEFKKELKDINEKVIGKFASVAKVDGTTLHIDIEEFYDFTHLEVGRYNDFRELINASADFYKSSLVLIKT
ncbi:MAG TPA: DUF3857 domain-containing protein [Flavobacterium sp.]